MWGNFFVMTTVRPCWGREGVRLPALDMPYIIPVQTCTLTAGSMSSCAQPPALQARNPFSKAFSAYDYAIDKWSNMSKSCVPPTFEDFCRQAAPHLFILAYSLFLLRIMS